MAKVHRGHVNLTSTSTQNTAPVFEHRCLYTHDIFKKNKKWHDGSLKFHTFNRRVMVYDDAKNYIGDLHYRQDEEFGEGLEIQLDKPVKVEVGERIGQTQTDLASVLAKPQTDRINDSPNGERQVARARVAGRIGQNKSIKDLLGLSQNRRGNGSAFLPQTSPYEQRQSLVPSHTIESPAKRRRIEAGKENEQPPVLEKGPIVVERTTYPPGSRYTTGRHNRPSTADVPRNAIPVVIDISSDDKHEEPLISSPPAFLQESNQRLTHKQNESENPKTQTSSERVGTRLLEAETNVRPIAASSLMELSAPVSSTNVSGPRSSLKLAISNPRRKLMYKALLPAQSPLPTLPAVHGSKTSHTTQKSLDRPKVSSGSKGVLAKASRQVIDIDESTPEHNKDDESIVLPSQDSQLSWPELFEDIDHASIQEAINPETNEVQPVDQGSPIWIDPDPLFVSCPPSQVSLGEESFRASDEDSRVKTPTRTPVVVSRDETLKSVSPRSPTRTSSPTFSQVARTRRVEQQNKKPSTVAETVNEDKGGETSEVLPGPAGEDNLVETLEREHEEENEQPTADVCAVKPDITLIASPQRSKTNAIVGEPPLPAVRSPEKRDFRRVRSENDCNNTVSEDGDEDTFSTVDADLDSQRRPNDNGTRPAVPNLQRSASASTRLHAFNRNKPLRDVFLNPAPLIRPPVPSHQVQQPVAITAAAAAAAATAPVVSARTAVGLGPTRPEAEHVRPTPIQPPDEHPTGKEEADQQGPWTNIEAFLLFDQWPSSKKKPDYGQQEHQRDQRTEGKSSTSATTRTNRNRTLLTRSESNGNGNGNGNGGASSGPPKKYSTFGSARFVSQR